MIHRLHFIQKLPISLEEGWKFFSSPANLKLITPTYLNFELTQECPKIYPGALIIYKIRPLLSLPLTWVTEITAVKENEYFVDEQRIGPYQFWHHEHHFKAIQKGIEIEDILYYSLPLGPIGELIHTLKVKKDVENIFAFRKTKLESLFGTVN